MKTLFTSAVLAIIGIVGSLAHAQGFDPYQQEKERCIAQIITGNYKNPAYEKYCHDYYNLPRAYLIKCVTFQVSSYPTDLDRKACNLYLSNNKDWGPWSDFDEKANLPLDVLDQIIARRKAN